MRELIIIAGPQAAGKSTVISQISQQYQNLSPFFHTEKPPLLFSLQESRQIIVHKNALLGAIFMTPKDELEVAKCDLDRMDSILERNSNGILYLDECNIFTIAHAVGHGITQIQSYWDEYISRLKKFNAKIIFLHIPPEISWERRKRSYQQRLVYFPDDQRNDIIFRYEDYTRKVYPELLSIYQRLPFPKEMIDGCQSPENVIHLVSQAVARLYKS